LDLVLLFIYIGFVGILFFIITAVWFSIYYFVIRKKFYIPNNSDIQIFITKENRFEMNFQNLNGARLFKYNNETYHNIVNCSIPNTRGKVLSIHNKGKPQPLLISYNETKWLDNASLNSIMTNEMIPKLLQPKDLLKEVLLLLSVIFSFVACITVIIVALKLFGVIKGKPIQIQVIPTTPTQ
jgi:hypothetical protein